MTSPAVLAAGLRAHAQGLCCPEAAAELLIAQTWLHRDDFTSRFITVHPGIGSGQSVAVIDPPQVTSVLWLTPMATIVGSDGLSGVTSRTSGWPRPCTRRIRS